MIENENIHNNYYSWNDDNIIHHTFDHVIYLLSIDAYNVYHSYFMKFYLYYYTFGVIIDIMIENENIQHNNYYSWNDDNIIDHTFDHVIYLLSIDTYNVYHSYFMKFYLYYCNYRYYDRKRKYT